MAESYKNILKARIGRVRASVKCDDYFPVVGQTVRIDARTEWGQSSEWRTQDGGGDTVSSAGNLTLQADSKEVTVRAGGEFAQKFIARNYLSETESTRMVYPMPAQSLPYFDLTAGKEVIRADGETTQIRITLRNGYSRGHSVLVRVYRENTYTEPVFTATEVRQAGDYEYVEFSTRTAGERGIYDVEADVIDTATGQVTGKRANKLITVTPALCPKPADTTQGYEVAATYKAETGYGGTQTFELRLWRDVDGSGLNYAEAVLPRGGAASSSYERIPVGRLPGGTTLCLVADSREAGPYPCRFLADGIVDAGTGNGNGSPDFTYEAPLVVTHDYAGIWEWIWQYYGAFNVSHNLRNIVLDGRGYHDTGIRFTPLAGSTYNSCFFLSGGSSDIEIFGIDIDGSGFAGISAKTDPSPDSPWYWRENGWELRNLKIHHSTIQNTYGEGVYLGYYGNGLMSGSDKSGNKVSYHAHLLRGLRLYRCRFFHTGFDPVQINNSVDTEVCYLDIGQCCYKKEVNQSNTFSCIMDGRVYNCKVWDNYSTVGIIFPFLSSLEIFNCVLVADKDTSVFSQTHWSEQGKGNEYYDPDETGMNDTHVFRIYNNVIKGRRIATIGGNIAFSGFTMDDNLFITSEGDNSLPGYFSGDGNVFVTNKEEYDVLDSYLKIADSADYDYQPNYNSLLVSAGKGNLSGYDMRGYKRWFAKVCHCGPLMGIYKDGTLADVSVELLSVLVNNGSPSVLEREVSVTLLLRGSAADYRLGEKADLSDAAWLPLTGESLPYVLSEGYGGKTLYAQVRNATDESNIASVTVTYQSTPLSLDDITLGGGYNLTVNVAFTFSGSFTPARYRLGENADLSDAGWEEYTDNIRYTFASAGEKTLYGQLQDAQGNVSGIRSAVMSVTAETRKAVISFGWNRNNLENKAGQQFDPVNKLTRVAYYATPLFYWRDGTEAGSLQQLDAYYASSSIMSETSKGASTGNDSGMYPDEILEHNTVLASNSTAYRSCLIRIPAGRYRIRLFCSTIFIRESTPKMSIQLIIGEGEAEVVTTVVIPENYTVINNLSEWLEQEITVPASGEFKLNWGIKDAGGTYYACPLNLVEIEEL